MIVFEYIVQWGHFIGIAKRFMVSEKGEKYRILGTGGGRRTYKPESGGGK